MDAELSSHIARMKDLLEDPTIASKYAAFTAGIRNRRLTTPQKTPAIVTFCRTLDPDSSPRYLRPQPKSWCRANCCDMNVERFIAKEGGTRVNGYRIWALRDLYAEAEQHCVWCSPEGELRDLTFSEDGEEKILFLPSTRVQTVRIENLGQKPITALDPDLDEIVRIEAAVRSRQIVERPPPDDIWHSNPSYKKWKKSQHARRPIR